MDSQVIIPELQAPYEESQSYFPLPETCQTAATAYEADPIGSAHAVQGKIYPSYTIWLERQELERPEAQFPNPADNPYMLCKPFKLIHLTIYSHWSFEVFKQQVLEALPGPDADFPSIFTTLKQLDRSGLLKWHCIIHGHPTYAMSKRYLATDTKSFQQFATAVGFIHSGETAEVRLTMDKPADKVHPEVGFFFSPMYPLASH